MENRIVGMLATFLFIVCFASGVSYFFEIDSRKSEYERVKTLLESNKSGIATKQAQLDAIRVQYDRANDTVNTFTQLTEGKTRLTKEIGDLKAAKDKLAVEFADHVTRVRSSLEGTDLGIITLATGQGLQATKVQKFGETDVTLSHSLGVTRVTAENLPADLREKFRLGMAPYTLLVKSEPEAPAPSAPAPPSASPERNLSKVNKIQSEIDQRNNKIAQLEQVRGQWLDKASQLRSQASSAQINGRPTYTFNAQATQCEQNAQQAAQQALTLRNEIAQLQADMGNAVLGK